MAAYDNTFTWRQVGIGTFDDHGNFDDVVLRGERVASEKPTPQSGPDRRPQR